ncbi:MAG: SCO family protein [Saprospiraceae bacterium]
MRIIGLLMLVLLVASCGSNSVDPNQVIIVHEKDKGKLKVIKDSIPSFSFVNQNNDTITNETFKGKVYVTDFFFTTCPSICVPMSKEMSRIYDKYKNDDRVMLLSHSIDTKNDTVEVLKDYETKLDVSADKWHFVTGDWEEIKKMAAVYMIAANIAKDAPGGYEHSGMFVLVDRKGQIRGFCNGTDEAAVSILMEDMDLLLDEK